MKRLLLVALPGNEAFAARLASALDATTGTLVTRRFPDGESYVRLDTDVSGRDVAFVCSLKDPDPQILALLFAAREAVAAGATRVGLVAPYLAYMRQDARFRSGEALTSAHFAELLSRYFAWLVTLDPHLHRWKRLDDIYTLRSRVAHAAEDIGRWIREHVDRPRLLGPDAESEQWVGEVARAADAEFVVLTKTRRGDRDVAIELPQRAGWADRTPVLVDDIVSSAHTMIAVLQQWHRVSARRPVCVAVHAVFSEGAHRELSAAGPAQIVTTNSIAHETNAIDVAHRLADGIRSLLESTERDRR